MYLSMYSGVDKYRAGMYFGLNEWMSAANAFDRVGTLKNSCVTLWMPLPEPPQMDCFDEADHPNPEKETE